MKDPYVYKDTNVLINLEDIRNQEDLDEFESTMYKLSFTKLENDNFVIKDTKDLFTIHGIHFNQVYKWAGKPRKINIYKEEAILNGLSVDYCDYSVITKEINKVNKDFNKVSYGNNNEQVIKDISKVIAKLWQVHPFREGNTRTIGTFLYFWIKQLGIELNRNFIGENAKFFRNALVLASIGEYSEYEYLESILMDATISNIKQTIKDDAKYKKIKGYDLKEYKYNYHHIKQ